MIARRADVVLAGVGGQGVLSAAALLADAAVREGLTVVQGEVHGMAQRGGAVLATVRMADGAVHGPLVPMGTADLVVGMEPVEALRAIEYLAPSGTVVTSTDPHPNVPGYPSEEELLDALAEQAGAVLIPAVRLARAAGLPRVANVVVTGAACRFLPIGVDTVEEAIRSLLARHGDRVVEANLRALRAGWKAAAGAEEVHQPVPTRPGRA